MFRDETKKKKKNLTLPDIISQLPMSCVRRNTDFNQLVFSIRVVNSTISVIYIIRVHTYVRSSVGFIEISVFQLHVIGNYRIHTYMSHGSRYAPSTSVCGKRNIFVRIRV